MPKCTILFHRHSGIGTRRIERTYFVHDKLKTLLDKKLGNGGGALHVIHDYLPSLVLTTGLCRDFETIIRSQKAMRLWKEGDREWRAEVKKSLEKADFGEETLHLNMALSPEAAFIIELNRMRPGTVINHLGWYPFEAFIENNRFMINSEIAYEKAGINDMDGAVEHLKEAHSAMASCALLRDAELFRQVGNLGIDFVVLRSLNHLYIGSLENLGIPVKFEDGGFYRNLFDYVSGRGIVIAVEIEPVKVTFCEEAVNRLCSGDMDEATHSRLSRLQLLMLEALGRDHSKLGNDELVRAARKMARRQFDREIISCRGRTDVCL